jgi:Fe2+ or Zn2+ uptake regulation protein
VADRPHTLASDEALTAALRSRRLRVTPQRLLIHRALCELDRHVSADELLDAVKERLPNASLPTVYATLELLERLGLVYRVSAGAGPTLYDPRADRHHHVICRECGSVEDLDAPVDSGAAVRAARRHGFVPDREELVVTGVCASCR